MRTKTPIVAVLKYDCEGSAKKGYFDAYNELERELMQNKNIVIPVLMSLGSKKELNLLNERLIGSAETFYIPEVFLTNQATINLQRYAKKYRVPIKKYSNKEGRIIAE